MNLIKDAKSALKISVEFTLATPLLLRSGQTGDITDSSIERAPKSGDKEQLFVNGYVWASLLRRSLFRFVEGQDLARQIGKDQGEAGVSPLWCDSTVTELHATAVNPGIAIDRQWGSAKTGALFSDELAIAGLPITFNATLFVNGKEEAEKWQKALLKALKIIDLGAENIGGGWTYGYGRLNVKSAKFATLDLAKPSERKLLWQNQGLAWGEAVPAEKLPQANADCTVIDVRAKVAAGQFLAVKSGVFPLDATKFGKLPDSFVFRRNRWNLGEGVAEQLPVIPGKAIRQALLSVPLERKLRSKGEKACYPNTEKSGCTCKRCSWFGSTEAAGIIAVTDAPVTGFDTEVISRVQLCEHSMQNMNLFSGEYLTQGNFNFRIIIDESRKSKDTDNLVKEVEALLQEMKGENAPPGWYRLGSTSTCTGQVQVIDYHLTRSVEP